MAIWEVRVKRPLVPIVPVLPIFLLITNLLPFVSNQTCFLPIDTDVRLS
jgi:hypothetical protein